MLAKWAALGALALGGCSGAERGDPRGVDRDEVLLQVVATGRADARPDEARFTAGVETREASARAAGAGNAAKMNAVLAALAGLGVKPDDVQTRSVTLQRVDYGPERGRFVANNLVEVRLRDVAKAGTAIAAVTEAGANVLSGPDLRVGDPEAAGRAAYAQAYRAARARAEAYAAAAGLKVARVLAIRDGGEAGAPPYPYATMDAMATEARAQVAAPPPPVQPGLNRSAAQVRADFALEVE